MVGSKETRTPCMYVHKCTIEIALSSGWIVNFAQNVGIYGISWQLMKPE